jgi:7-dehydrocholesterol reductase
MLDNFYIVYLCASVIGTFLGIAMYIRGGDFWHTHGQEGILGKMYTFVMGQELHPQFMDRNLKLFFNGRPGIIGWSVINIACAAYQYDTYGFVSLSMICINIMQGIYVVDFFWNEKWYLNTIDMMHDKFGWYLTWGDCVWLPFMYTLQGVYLSSHPQPTEFEIYALVLCVTGYGLFRVSNMQKDRFKQETLQPVHVLSRSKISFIQTLNGGKLLTSGCWGWARHVNYTADLIMAFSYGLCTGFKSPIPWFYFVFMLILLVGRCYRDEARCKKKYGSDWDKYCQEVPWRLIRGIY